VETIITRLNLGAYRLDILGRLNLTPSHLTDLATAATHEARRRTEVNLASAEEWVQMVSKPNDDAFVRTIFKLQSKYEYEYTEVDIGTLATGANLPYQNTWDSVCSRNEEIFQGLRAVFSARHGFPGALSTLWKA
jgi:hypothetical protein